MDWSFSHDFEHFLPLMIFLNSRDGRHSVQQEGYVLPQGDREGVSWTILCGSIPKQMELLMHHHPISSLPQNKGYWHFNHLCLKILSELNIFSYSTAKMVDAVYDVTVTYCDKVTEKGELDILSGTFPKQMEFLVQCHSISSLPQNKDYLNINHLWLKILSQLFKLFCLISLLNSQDGWCSVWRDGGVLRPGDREAWAGHPVWQHPQADGSSMCSATRSSLYPKTKLLKYWLSLIEDFVTTLKKILSCIFYLTAKMVDAVYNVTVMYYREGWARHL